MRLGTVATTEDVAGFDEVVMATGVRPRSLDIPGSDRPEVVSYVDVLNGTVQVGTRIAIVGAGGIGFDVADFLTHDADEAGFMASWGVDTSLESRGGLAEAQRTASQREVHMYQRRPGKMGKGLGKTTGWIHRNTLKQRGVKQWSGVSYDRVDDQGFHVTLGDGTSHLHAVDHVVVCAGQVSLCPRFVPPQPDGHWRGQDAKGLMRSAPSWRVWCQRTHHLSPPGLRSRRQRIATIDGLSARAMSVAGSSSMDCAVAHPHTRMAFWRPNEPCSRPAFPSP